jgi:hypothetical protein
MDEHDAFSNELVVLDLPVLGGKLLRAFIVSNSQGMFVLHEESKGSIEVEQLLEVSSNRGVLLG